MRIALMALALLASTNAAAQNVSSKVKTAAFLETIATRGAECGLLRPWQAASLRALNLHDMKDWPVERRIMLPAEVARQLVETDCETQAMTLWIEASSKGFDSEMLPPYLVVYRRLAQSAAPPPIFTQTAARVRFAPAIDAINKKLAYLEASGAVAEGGKPWPEYITNTEEAAAEFATLLDDETAPLDRRNEAAGWIAQSVHIVELWLLDEE